MSKLIQIPGKISELNTTHINPIRNLRNPITFDLGTQNLTYPYIWNPGETLTFTYTLPETTEEVIIDEIYRYGDNTDPGDPPFSKLIVGSGTVDLTLSNYIILKTNGKQYRLFNEDPADELSNGISISRFYGEMVDSDEVLYGHSNTVTSHILHNDAVGKKIVLSGYNLIGKTVTVTYKSEESTPFTLNQFVTMEPYLARYTVSQRFAHLSIEVANDKIFMCGDIFTYFANVSGAIQVYDKSTSNATPINVQGSQINPILTTTVESENVVHGFSVTSNVLNSDEYLLAIICGTNNHDMLLYDSSINTWTNRNSSFSNNNTPGGIYMSENSGSPMWGKKPLDIKHLSSTGNVHALLTCFEDTTYKPKVLYSDSNMENWTTIFDESKLTSAVNSNIYGPITIQASDSNCISLSTFSKIIDENTMFAEFCSYTTNNKYINSNPINGYNAQFLLKTEDGGSTWIDVMKDHPEYAFSGTVRNYISDDGQKIYSMIFYKQKSGTTTYTFLNFPISTYNDNIVLFNYSEDGGSNWKYSSGNWSIISSSAFSQYFQITSGFKISRTVNQQQQTHQTMIYPYISTGEIIAVLLNSSSELVHYISRDGGDTWITGYGEIYGNINDESPLQRELTSNSDGLQLPDSGAHFTAEPFDSNDSFAAYVGYVGAEDGNQINLNPDTFSVSDYLFYSLGGGYGGYSSLYDEDNIKKAHIYIPTNNTTSKISKLKGYYK